MPRTARNAPGGYVFHVLNRGVARLQLFSRACEYEIFTELLWETQEKYPMRICGYCIMPNHWHLLLWPEEDGQLASFMQRLTTTHVCRLKSSWEVEHTGHLYQGRYKSFPVQTSNYYLNVLRYIEANPLRKNLARKAEDWQWSSIAHRDSENGFLLDTGPMVLPPKWKEIVNSSMALDNLKRIRYSATRGAPYGTKVWTKNAANDLNLLSSLRTKGRPPAKK